ncbi:MAG: FecR family protein [Saprospiraceae bacterium]
MNIDNIIQRALLGQADKEELAILEQWKAESKENLKQLSQLHNIQSTSENLRTYQDVDTERAWSAVESKLYNDKGIQKYYKVALIAVLFFGLSLVGYFIFQKYFNKTEGIYIANGISEPTFHMTDGSELELSENAILTQTAYRQVSLEGKAYFKIAKDSKYSFIVKTHHGVLTVVGTEFNIVTDEKHTQIYVAEGKVTHEFNGQIHTLEKDNVLELNGKVAKVLKGNYSYLSAWKSGVLRFENATLHEVMDALSAFYNISIHWESQQDDHCKINTVITNEKVGDVLKELTLISGLRYELKKGKIVIKSFKCQ